MSQSISWRIFVKRRDAVKHYLLLFIISLALTCQAQVFQYMSRYFESESKVKTHQIRFFEKKGGFVEVADINHDTVEIEGKVSTTDIAIANDVISFLRAGSEAVKSTQNIKDVAAEFTHYRDNGKPLKHSVIKGLNIYITQAWDDFGNTVLSNGSGILKHFKKSENGLQVEVIKDSAVVEAYTILANSSDTIHATLDTKPQPKAGYEKFSKQIGRILYKELASAPQYHERLLYVQFVVDRSGKLRDFKLLSKEKYSFEERVVEKLKLLPDWYPGIFQSRPVNVRFAVPITFAL